MNRVDVNRVDETRADVTEPPAPPPLAKKPRGALFWVLAIGGPLVLCCGGGLLWALWQGADALRIITLPPAQRAAALSDMLTKMAPAETAAVDTFMGHLDAGRDAEAWAMTSAGWRGATPQPKSDEFLALVRSVMGPCTSKNLVNVNKRSVVGGLSTTELTYDATFANGGGMIHVTTVAGAAGPEIHAFRVDSPLFMQAAQRGVQTPVAPEPPVTPDDGSGEAPK